MIDGKGHRSRWRNIGRIGNLLEIGFQGKGQREKQVVYHKQGARQHHAPAKHVNAAICQKDQGQTRIFKDQSIALPVARHNPAKHRPNKHIHHEVD